MLSSEELIELFIDTEANEHNQRNTFKKAVIQSRRNHFTGTPADKEKIHFDSPLMFDLGDILKEVRETNELIIVTDEKAKKTKQGSLYGKLTNVLDRLESRNNDRRLNFLLGDAVAIPSVVRIDACDRKPASNDIPYFERWKEPWRDLDIAAIKEEWFRK